MKNSLVLALSLSLAACTQSALPHHKNPRSAAASQLSPSVLAGYSWQLVQATNTQNQTINGLLLRPDQPVSLQFNANHLAVLNTCNHLAGTFRLQGKVLTVEHLIATMRACDPAINQLDSLMHQIIEGRSSLKIARVNAQPVLTLISASGDTLVFNGIATAESKYGTAAETIFLEVSPKRPSCHAGVRQMQCLQVRQVKYNEQGLKSHSSTSWQNFYDPIEGYSHHSNERVIIRVKKYALKHPPAGASRAAYVLDRVVEREQVN